MDGKLGMHLGLKLRPLRDTYFSPTFGWCHLAEVVHLS